jgi:hypothetical protein
MNGKAEGNRLSAFSIVEEFRLSFGARNDNR